MSKPSQTAPPNWLFDRLMPVLVSNVGLVESVVVGVVGEWEKVGEVPKEPDCFEWNAEGDKLRLLPA